MRTQVIKGFLLGMVALSMTTFSFAQQSKNPFLDGEYWKSKPSIADIDANIAEGYSITEANSGGFDPTTYAIFGGNPVSTIDYLIKKGNDVNKRTHDARTYIFWAASRGDVAVVKYLIEQGAKLDVEDSHGYSVSSFAAAGGQQDAAIFDLLIKNGADLKHEKDHHGKNIMLVAIARAKDLSLIDYLVEQGLDIDTTDDHGNGIFHYAAQGGNIEVMKALVKRGVSTAANKETGENAILFASRGGRGSSNGLEVFTYLEGLGIQPNVTSKEGITPLHNLLRSSDNLAIYKYFIEKGVNPNAEDQEGNTALLNAASRNKLEVISFLVDGTHNVNHANAKGSTALALAVQNNTEEVVTYLIEKGASVTVVDKEGNSLVHYLFDTRGLPRDFDKKVAALKAKGLDFSTPQAGDKTVWHLAGQKNNVKLLSAISALGVDINKKDNQGNTPLHYAAMETDNAEILKFLLAQGADAKLTTEFGETAYDLASENELLSKNNVNVSFLN